MKVRLAELKDKDKLMSIFDTARHFMRDNGNTTQWTDGYPSWELMEEEIGLRHCYVCEDETGEVRGTFCFIKGPDPTYAKIYDGAWLNDRPYYVIHRMASDGVLKGVADYCFNWCLSLSPDVRVDTHRENTVMQHILQKHGFKRCGIILVKNGTERIAYQRTSF